MLCNINLTSGCPRCHIVKPTICCELCSPLHFTNFAISNIPKPKPKAQRSKIKTNYKYDKRDMDLATALHEFRRQKTIEKFGRASLRNHGPGAIMGNDILDRIVDCAHAGRISSKEELRKETRWAGVNDYGDEVLSLIQAHCPLPPRPLPSDSQLCLNNYPTNISGAVRQVQRRHCNACGAIDHIGKGLTVLKIAHTELAFSFKQALPEICCSTSNGKSTTCCDCGTKSASAYNSRSFICIPSYSSSGFLYASVICRVVILLGRAIIEFY
jgi:hypothetical protein